MTNRRSLKTRIKEGECITGCFVNFYAPQMIEALSATGFDFFILDSEHGSFTYSELENMIRASDYAGVDCVVRVNYDPSSIQKALDMGASGIQVPMVNSREDVLDAVLRAKYPPVGRRGADLYSRAYQKYTGELAQFFASQNHDTLVVAQIETPKAVLSVEEIAAVEGVDVLFVGTMDLSVSMGATNPNTPHVAHAVDKIYATAKKAQIAMGSTFMNARSFFFFFEKGSTFLATTLINCLKCGVREVLGN